MISNFEAEDDTLVSVASDMAQLTEIHESYEQGNDMIGMREVANLPVPAHSTLNFRPGGLHTMLIQLTDGLRENDEFVLRITFGHVGEIILTVAVRD